MSAEPIERIAGIRVATGGSVDLDGRRLKGVSLGGIRTCLELPEWNLIVDLGAVDQQQVYAQRVLLTHAHLDHLGGLANHIALRELMGQPSAEYFFPPSIESKLERLLEVWRELDRAPLQANLIPLAPGTVRPIQRDLAIEPFATQHRVDSQGYLIWRVTQKLNPELQGLPSVEIGRLRAAGQNVTHEERLAEFAFSGDTTLAGMLAHPKVLRAKRIVMEATFLDDLVSIEKARRLGHVHLDEIAEHAEAFECEFLVLTHLSQRYSLPAAAQIVRKRMPKELHRRVILL